ncbi:protein spdB, partial [Candidatus Frankia alpina]|uniref:protein spdB n=1 Tax=Candidatus Frankia alpina TaxID=2699483 RepID=UPI0039A32F8E
MGWLGALMPWPVATVVGLGMDGGWLATLAYERRLAAQGDHSPVVSGQGWTFGLLATGVLVAHALVGPSPAGWLAVAWLPLAAKALWLVHGLWERTALTPTALEEIRAIRQAARDDAAVSRARLSAQAGAEETRLAAVTAAGVRVARVQARTAHTLAAAWTALAVARDGEDTGRALTCVTSRVTPGVTPGVTPRWELPVWESSSLAVALPAPTARPDDGGFSDAELDAVVDEIRCSQAPPLSYREMALRFRAAGRSAAEMRLRAAWRR